MPCGFASLCSVQERAALDYEEHQDPPGHGWAITVLALLQPQEEGTAGVTLCFPSSQWELQVVPASSVSLRCHHLPLISSVCPG